MLRITSISIFLLVSLSVSCQTLNTEEFDNHLKEGKAEFKKKFEDQDFQKAVGHLEKAVELNSENQEAWYFLGYAYSRLNAKDGKGIMGMRLDLTVKCSDAFEKCISIKPKYEGELVSQDPYFKLTSEWGSLALKHLFNDNIDSANWAFKEGKKRGGFDDFTLNLNKKILESCSENAILIASGDNILFPLYYMQTVENYRKDVSVIDVTLLNTQWYPHLLAERKEVAFDVTLPTLDTINYMPWKDSIVTISNISWTLKPSYYRQFILRGDRVLLSLLRANDFKRAVFFTMGFDEKAQLSLKEKLSSRIVVDKLRTEKTDAYMMDKYMERIKSVLLLSKHVNQNSPNQIAFYDMLRYNLLGQVNTHIDIDRKEMAEMLLEIFDEYGAEKTVPFFSEQGTRYTNHLRNKLSE